MELVHEYYVLCHNIMCYVTIINENLYLAAILPISLPQSLSHASPCSCHFCRNYGEQKIYVSTCRYLKPHGKKKTIMFYTGMCMWEGRGKRIRCFRYHYYPNYFVKATCHLYHKCKLVPGDKVWSWFCC